MRARSGSDPSMLRDVLADGRAVERNGRAERTAECPTPLREAEADRIKVQGRTPTRQPTTGVRDQNALDRYDA